MTDDRAAEDAADRTAELDRLEAKLDGLGDDADRLADRFGRLESRLDRLALLLAVLVLVELVHVGGDLILKLGLAAVGLGFLGLVAVFLFALKEGL
ncbi:hypothetical protein M0R89_07740 [Halorussus limi]|uniref:Uncharacterized protein n=1 Tax=Halorussus limi TaxID=2938695 RepID=A0A8U0HZ40_9EURY|nr:hypothetical protein [Halorussus limi]UPV75941.1 hypothetical protein M0R89_07740 [Halorussus limi]